MISAESMEELLGKLKTLKSEGEEGLASENWEDKAYGVWHEFGPIEES